MPSASTSDPAALVRAHLAAFAAGALDALLDTLAPDASFATGATVVPPAEWPEFFGWAMRELDPAVQITSLVAADGVVACEFVESITRDGQREHLTRAAFYRVEGGLITRVQVYDLRDD